MPATDEPHLRCQPVNRRQPAWLGRQKPKHADRFTVCGGNEIAADQNGEQQGIECDMRANSAYAGKSAMAFGRWRGGEICRQITRKTRPIISRTPMLLCNSGPDDTNRHNSLMSPSTGRDQTWHKRQVQIASVNTWILFRSDGRSYAIAYEFPFSND